MGRCIQQKSPPLAPPPTHMRMHEYTSALSHVRTRIHARNGADAREPLHGHGGLREQGGGAPGEVVCTVYPRPGGRAVWGWVAGRFWPGVRVVHETTGMVVWCGVVSCMCCVAALLDDFARSPRRGRCAVPCMLCCVLPCRAASPWIRCGCVSRSCMGPVCVPCALCSMCLVLLCAVASRSRV